MPNKTELRKMTKPQLIDFGCEFFTDDGNLRQELEGMKKEDLLDLLFENDAHINEEKTPEPEVSVKPGPVSKLDLGNW